MGGDGRSAGVPTLSAYFGPEAPIYIYRRRIGASRLGGRLRRRTVGRRPSGHATRWRSGAESWGLWWQAQLRSDHSAAVARSSSRLLRQTGRHGSCACQMQRSMPGSRRVQHWRSGSSSQRTGTADRARARSIGRVARQRGRHPSARRTETPRLPRATLPTRPLVVPAPVPAEVLDVEQNAPLEHDQRLERAKTETMPCSVRCFPRRVTSPVSRVSHARQLRPPSNSACAPRWPTDR